MVQGPKYCDPALQDFAKITDKDGQPKEREREQRERGEEGREK